MKIVITSNGTDLDSPMSPIFGRCPTFLFVEDDVDEIEAVPNPAVDAHGGDPGSAICR